MGEKERGEGEDGSRHPSFNVRSVPLTLWTCRTGVMHLTIIV